MSAGEASAPPEASRTWRKPPFIANALLRRALLVATIAYLIAAFASIDVNWARVYEGLERGWNFILAFSRPNFLHRWIDIRDGMVESIIMTVASTVVGVAISIPIGLGAARNIAALPVYLICRGIITLSRALHEIIVAILMVAIFGFGPLAGFITLSFATIGFLSKLLAEDIEAMDRSQAEAIRATGGSWLQWINYGVQPQVMPRLIGLSMYRLDINFRESAILGLVGAGGIGLQLDASISTLAWTQVSLILLVILATVIVSEWVSAKIRHAII